MPSKIVQFKPTNWFEIKNQTADSADIYIYDIISPWLPGSNAKDVITQLKSLSEVKTLNVRINSPGGSVFEGVAIANALKRHPGEVITHVDGLAASIASVIALAGSKVIMAKSAMLMIHQAEGDAYGRAEELRKVADVLDQLNTTIASVYVDKTGKKLQTILNWMDEEKWFTAQEAVDAKMADEIVDGMAVAAQFDLKDFGYQKVPTPLASATPPPVVVPPAPKTPETIPSTVAPRSLLHRKQALLEKQ